MGKLLEIFVALVICGMMVSWCTGCHHNRPGMHGKRPYSAIIRDLLANHGASSSVISCTLQKLGVREPYDGLRHMRKRSLRFASASLMIDCTGYEDVCQAVNICIAMDQPNGPTNGFNPRKIQQEKGIYK